MRLARIDVILLGHRVTPFFPPVTLSVGRVTLFAGRVTLAVTPRVVRLGSWRFGAERLLR